MINNKTADIYEQDRVHGVETDLTDPDSNRLAVMLKFAASLKNPPQNVLDIGCGTGYFATQIKKIYPHARVVGVDISTNALAAGRREHKDIEFVQADAETKLPFKNGTFDLIISGENIEHVVDTDLYLIELNRVLTMNGSLLITTPNLASWMNRIFLLLGRQPYYLEPSLHKTLPIIKIGNYTFPQGLENPASGHLRLFTPDALKKLLALYGLKTESTRGYYMLRRFGLAQLDRLFCLVPGLAFGLVLKVRKTNHAHI